MAKNNAMKITMKDGHIFTGKEIETNGQGIVIALSGDHEGHSVWVLNEYIETVERVFS